MTKVYVGNLPAELTGEGLRQLFSFRGFLVDSARVICDREGGPLTRIWIRGDQIT